MISTQLWGHALDLLVKRFSLIEHTFEVNAINVRLFIAYEGGI